MGDKKEMQYRGYYATYCYDERLEIWYGKTCVSHLSQLENTELGRVPATEHEVAFASMNRVNLEEQFHAIVEKDIGFRESE